MGKQKQTTKKKKKKNKKSKLTAKSANKFELYEASVQDPPSDVKFLDKIFRKEGKPKPMTLREDFCGTAKLCASWVESAEGRTATGLDLDQPTLDYGLKKHIEPLGDKAKQVSLLKRNVLDGAPQKHDVVVAFNFSYWIFKERKQLLDYFKRVRQGVADGGAFVLDIYGGPEAQEAVEEATKHKGFTYVWDQDPMDAISGNAMRYIHFKFSDGSKIHKAFVYDWRIWSLPEVRDLLKEAGFSQVDVYWEGTDKDGEGNGVFKKRTKAENEASWIAYIVGWK